MSLPENFQFSQGNLQDFTDCRRRFYLRYLRQVAWPAVEAEPIQENERWMQQGVAFHRILHQFFLGIPAERLSSLIMEEDLLTWWGNFVEYYPSLKGISDPGASLYPEISLSIPFAGTRLVAKYDLLVTLPDGRAFIYDWKTSHRVTRRNWLQKHLQTRIYMFLLAEAGHHVTQGNRIEPDKIAMTYWFSAFPSKPVEFSYNTRQYQDDKEYLSGLVEQVNRLALEEEPESFPLTPDIKSCRFCVYRSLCNRGINAGSLDEIDVLAESETEPINLDFDQVQEIEF